MTGLPVVAVNGRWSLRMPEHRAARPEWPWWEAARLAAMHHVITSLAYHRVPANRMRPVVLDVGTEEGDFPGLWSSWGADVMLVEPNPLVWPNVRAIFEANHLRPPLAMFVGFCGDEARGDQSASLSWPQCAYGPVIGDHGFCQLNERPDMPATTVDRLVALTEVVPDVITMDVEGSELHVLQGAIATMAEHRPDVFVSIHPEFMDEQYGTADGVATVRRLMADLRYHEVFLATDHEQHWWFSPTEVLA